MIFTRVKQFTYLISPENQNKDYEFSITFPTASVKTFS